MAEQNEFNIEINERGKIRPRLANIDGHMATARGTGVYANKARASVFGWATNRANTCAMKIGEITAELHDPNLEPHTPPWNKLMSKRERWENELGAVNTALDEVKALMKSAFD